MTSRFLKNKRKKTPLSLFFLFCLLFRMSYLAKKLIEGDKGFQRVKFNPFKKGYFIDKDTRLSGITKKLQSCFWPNYTLKTSKPSERDKLNMAFTVGKTFDAKSKNDGRARGSILHKEIEEFTKMKNSSPEKFEEYKKKLISDQLHGITYFTLIALSEYGLRPIIPELRVGSKDDKLGTAVDIVCTNEQDEICLVELKSGYAGVFSVGDNQLDKLYLKSGESNTDCPLNQAIIQLSVTAVLYEKTFSDLAKATKFYVLNVNDREDPKLYRLVEDKSVLFENRHEIYEIFLSYLKEQQEEADGKRRRRRSDKGTKRKKKEDTNSTEKDTKKVKRKPQ